MGRYSPGDDPSEKIRKINAIPYSISMSDAITQIKQLLPASSYMEDIEKMQPYTQSWRGNFNGKSPLIVFPSTTQQLAQIVTICHETYTPIVPQGGNTGLVGGSTPDTSNQEIVVNLSRMNKISTVDTVNNTVTVEAGCILANLQEHVAREKLLFPLSMASEGSAEIGGIISTNAGGTAVLRYGSMRSLVLGLEFVLPNGEIVNQLSSLYKDNTGYDLKHYLIGAEGTLGIITRAVLKLFPCPNIKETALVSLTALDKALPLLRSCRQIAEETLTTFELVPVQGLDLIEEEMNLQKLPLTRDHEWMLLIELTAHYPKRNLRSLLESILEEAFEQQWLADGYIAENLRQSSHLWMIREQITESMKKKGRTINFDVAVPISSIADFIIEASKKCRNIESSLQIMPFGHVGDGNIHFNMLLGDENITDTPFYHLESAIKTTVFQIIDEYNGSISAEHGIGSLRKEELLQSESPESLAMMRLIKQAIDPRNILNPNRIFDFS